MSPLLAVSHLTIRRGPATLVDDLNESVHPGQHWVILGANGSGKTSLLRAGRALAAGPIRAVLTTPLLTAAFDAPLRIRRRDGRYLATPDQPPIS